MGPTICVGNELAQGTWTTWKSWQAFVEYEVFAIDGWLDTKFAGIVLRLSRQRKKQSQTTVSAYHFYTCVCPPEARKRAQAHAYEGVELSVALPSGSATTGPTIQVIYRDAEHKLDRFLFSSHISV